MLLKNATVLMNDIISSVKQPVPDYMEFRGTDRMLLKCLSRCAMPLCPSACFDERPYAYGDCYVTMASEYIQESDYAVFMKTIERMTQSKPLTFNRVHSCDDDFLELFVTGFYDEETERVGTSVTIQLKQALSSLPYLSKTTVVSSLWKESQKEEAIHDLKAAITSRLVNLRGEFANFARYTPYYGSASSWAARFPESLSLIEAV